MPETERLLLRRFAPADADAFAALNADPEVMRFIGDGTPLTRAQSDELLTRIAGHWRSHGFGLWCVAERAAPEQCLGFAGPGRAVVPARGHAGREVGWRVARDAWGRGLATEAARAALDEAFGPLGLASVISIIAEGNERSVRVADKLGMRRGADRLHPTRGRLRIYEISADDAASSCRGLDRPGDVTYVGSRRGFESQRARPRDCEARPSEAWKALSGVDRVERIPGDSDPRRLALTARSDRRRTTFFR